MRPGYLVEEHPKADNLRFPRVLAEAARWYWTKMGCLERILGLVGKHPLLE